jgi:hypothetical protein
MTTGANGPSGLAGIIDDPQQSASGMDEGTEADEKDEKVDPAEEKKVSKLWQGYDDARKFDENFRKQIAIDRRYAAGTSDLSWAVTTNLIGAFIDILVALLYARDPDVSARKAPQVDDTDTKQMEMFAKTLQIVVSNLWRKGKLKKAARKGVRSVLSNSEGWFKCLMVSEKDPNGEVQTALNDAKEMHQRLLAQQELLEDPDGQDPETIASELAEKQALVTALEAKLEVAVKKMFVIDFIPTEHMQVSTDVSCISDYLDANWIGNELFIEKDDALERFSRLDAEDLKTAKLYYQKNPKELTTHSMDNVLPQGQVTAESANMFVTSTSTPESPAFVRTVEIWDRRDRTIRTLIDGVKKWAKEPFNPPYPTDRFYPYFHFSFYEVDGERHAQSLSWRLYKLQDEYSAARSNFRLTRERSIPGVLFNGTMLEEAEAKKLVESKHQEYTALRPSDPSIPLGNLFAAKPVAAIDMRVFDPTYILSDMERISGVQEALSAAINGPGNPRTATEASIQQSGTNARTSADRDQLELMLTDMAQYTAQQALQCLTIEEVQRMAGKAAFWPENMDIEDLFTLVEIDITAGSTGKPRQGADQQAWATILPLVKQTLQEIEQALAGGNLPLAAALTELVKETMLRLGDESDSSRFIPQTPPPGTPGAGAPPPPVRPKLNISLKGELDPQTAGMLVAPAVAADARAVAPPPPNPGSPPAPVGATPGPAGPGPV